MKAAKDKGQVIIVAIVALVILAILIPAIIRYTQNESKWTVKEQHTTRAFELAEAGIERGYQTLILSTATLATVEAGGTVTSYNFDNAFSDLSGGNYEIKMVGNPVAQTVTVTSVGRDTTNSELRAIQAVYATPGAYPAAIYAVNSASILGNPTVEWGPVASPGPITTDASHTYPRYLSSGLISPFDANGATPPNTDNIQWWDYYNLPPPPQIDLQAYKAAALAQSATCVDNSGCLGTGAGCTICYYTAANYPTFDPGTNNYFDRGSNTALIVEGNLSFHGHYGSGSMTNVPIPPTAWKEYGNAWTYYKSMDSYANTHYATFASASSANYSASGITYPSIGSVFIHGFMYIGGTISISGGGNACIVGSIYCATVANLGSSHVTVYYDNNVIGTIKVKNSALTRTSWQETPCHWPAAGNAACP